MQLSGKPLTSECSGQTKEQESGVKRVTNVGRDGKLMIGCAACSNAQVGAHNMAAGAISQCVADTKEGAH